jgi:hypothetical protein
MVKQPWLERRGRNREREEWQRAGTMRLATTKTAEQQGRVLEASV